MLTFINVQQAFCSTISSLFPSTPDIEDMDHNEQPNNCPLLSLPPELRLRIYDYLYAEREHHRCTFTLLNSYSISAFTIPAFGHSGTAAHLRICKQINNEATSIFYSGIPFVLSIFGRQQPPVPLSVHYSSIHDCPTFRNIRNLTIILHVCNTKDIDCLLSRMRRALKLLDGRRRLQECHVQLTLYGRQPQIPYATAALAVVKRILELGRRGGLNTVECQVYTQLWSEAICASRRDFVGRRYRVADGEACGKAYEEFRGFLKRTDAGEAREVRNSERRYDLRHGTLVDNGSRQEVRRVPKRVTAGGRQSGLEYQTVA